ncbi:DUF3732 domain-containing protein [Xanthomonas euvesicatoria]|uniref:DUF3732 domain-containing protein n=1 Tax=Xanthomonas TaxID=338 RepID=UPI00052FA338|nr:DUF3732 domain-containing protein [Xanthomonas citri]CEI02243.1 Plasmid-related protein [Xanthomonas citri pv. citri]
MSIQILDIVIYHEGRPPRTISLKPGQVNIITGESGTGKSSLISIVDYCLGSGTCEIPHGIMAKTIHWYGLRLTNGTEEHFVARRAPDKGKATTGDAFYITGSALVVPGYDDLSVTTNIDAVMARIELATGIGAHRYVPPEGQTRPPLSASIRHALAYVFQKQTEISQPGFLFHGQGDHFVAQQIKDTFSYFIGAMEHDHVELSARLRALRRELRLKEAELSRSLSLSSEARIEGLVAEAKSAGLIDAGSSEGSYQDMLESLRVASIVPFEDHFARAETEVDQLALSQLTATRSELRVRLHLVNDELQSMSGLRTDGSNFAKESAEQVSRLESIGLIDEDEHTCPLCSHALTETVPSAKDLRAELVSVRTQLQNVRRHTPGLDTLIGEKTKELDGIKESLRNNWAALEAVRASDSRLQSMREVTSRRAHVLGRISLTLESLPTAKDNQQLQQTIETLSEQISELELQLSDESVRERTASAMSRVATLMTRWATFLELEHAGIPFRLDPKKLIVVADTEDGAVPMSRMGSGETWLSCHLIAFLALHEFFVRGERPVPRFLILDQPSQVYFPAEQGRDVNQVDKEDEDRLAVIRIFTLISNVTQNLSPRMQVIITEHADIQEPWYQDLVVERWRNGNALVPMDWADDAVTAPPESEV